MQCPCCNSNETSVFNSRPKPHGVIYRQRRCESCDFRFATVEVVKPTCTSLLTTAGAVRPLKPGRARKTIAEAHEAIARIGVLLRQIEKTTEAENSAAETAHARPDHRA